MDQDSRKVAKKKLTKDDFLMRSIDSIMPMRYDRQLLHANPDVDEAIRNICPDDTHLKFCVGRDSMTSLQKKKKSIVQPSHVSKRVAAREIHQEGSRRKNKNIDELDRGPLRGVLYSASRANERMYLTIFSFSSAMVVSFSDE